MIVPSTPFLDCMFKLYINWPIAVIFSNIYVAAVRGFSLNSTIKYGG
jgi:hypothetical protein